jgi:cysteinyl-tRNA synthetase
LSLKFTNTLSKKKEDFITINPNQVKIYCCGVTVYDLCHLGHARSYLNWDVLRRFLIWKGFEVKFVQNFTDIDDKIIKRAKEEGCSTDELSERNIDEFHKDMDTLSILRPSCMPKATKCLDQIINFIEELEKKKIAYSTNGDVYFSVNKHQNYGKLSGREIEDQIDNAAGRLKINKEKNKKNSLDFALWKKSNAGEVSYSSPWGNGRPGWHIECSAMVKQELGESIDIHLGGADLIFPHHENEIAQSEACNGKELARYWLHNGMVNVGGVKMSKSLGNFTTIRSLLDEGISPMTLRFFVLQTNYRKPLDFTEEALKAASKGWERLNNCLSFGYIFKIKDKNINEIELDKPIKRSINSKLDEDSFKLLLDFEKYMDDDLNTSGALSILFELCQPIKKFINLAKEKDINEIEQNELNQVFNKWLLLSELAGVLGLKVNLNKASQKNITKIDIIKIEELIKNRSLAKSNKDFLLADQIRTELKNIGIELIDKPGGITEWKQS